MIKFKTPLCSIIVRTDLNYQSISQVTVRTIFCYCWGNSLVMGFLFIHSPSQIDYSVTLSIKAPLATIMPGYLHCQQ